MCRHISAVTKLHFRTLAGAYWGVGSLTGFFLIQALVFVILMINGVFEMGSLSGLSIGNYLWLFPAIAAIQIPAYNFRRIINLGGKRDNFFWGSLMCYAIIAASVSLANTLMYYLLDSFLINTGYFGYIDNAVEAFGWAERGMLAVFIQQFAFLFLLAVFIHTLVAAQGKWYGWVADALIIAIISVFTPIAPLRAVLAGFFRLIIFSSPLLQITACLVLGLAIYWLSKIIFARKAI